MTKPKFIEVAGGRVISRKTGQDVLRVDVDSLTISEARRVMDVVLEALEADAAEGEDDPQTVG